MENTPRIANDNYSTEELKERSRKHELQQRKKELTEMSMLLEEAKDWARTQRRGLVSSNLSKKSRMRIQECDAALSPLEAAIEVADNLLEAAEAQPDSRVALVQSKQAMSRMMLVFEGAQQVVEE